MTRAVYSHASQCRGKYTYQRKGEAKRAIEQMRQRLGVEQLQERTRGRLMPYRCGHCGSWHIGHRSQNIKDVLARGGAECAD